MSRRAIILSTVCVLAGGVLIVALSIEPAGKTDARRGDEISLDDLSDPSGLPGYRGDGSAVGDPRRLTGPRDARDYAYASRNKKGQLIEFFGKTLDPLPGGVSKVGKPVARIHLKDHQRVIQITANEGKMRAPGNQPQSGELTGDVVLTLFESAPDARVNYRDNRDARLRLFLDEASFDLELNQIQSGSAVHVTGPRVDFRGKGLDLIYNAAAQRLERLNVSRGEVLRFAPQSSTAKAAKAPVRGDDTGKSKTPSEDTAKAPPPPQFYRALAVGDVMIDSRSAHIDAQQLALLFSFDRGEGGGVFDQLGDAEMPAREALVSAPSIASCAADLPVTAPADAGDISSRSLYRAADDEVVVRWSGPLIVEPIGERPAYLERAADIAATFTGDPVRVLTAAEETVECLSLRYLTSGPEVLLEGTIQRPVVIDSPTRGRVRGTSVELNERDGKGVVLGPSGQLTVFDGEVKPGAERKSNDLIVTFNDRLDLLFAPRAPRSARRQAAANADAAPAPAEQPDKLRSDLGPLRSATFAGSVSVLHRQFDLAGDKLAIFMRDESSIAADAPAAAGDADAAAPKARKRSHESLVDRIQVDGHVHARSRGDARDAKSKKAQDGPIAIASDHLELKAGVDEAGRSTLERMRAWGAVEVSQPGRNLRAGQVDATIAAAPRAADAGDDKDSTDRSARLTITEVTAESNVRISLDDDQGRVWADRLHADAATEQVQLFGSDDRPATFWRDDVLFTGPTIELDQRRKTVYVPSAGRLQFLSASRVKQAENAENTGESAVAVVPAPVAGRIDPSLRGAPPTQLQRDAGRTIVTVTWQRWMRYDDVAGRAQFGGSVKSESLGDKDQTYLLANQLDLRFAERKRDASKPGDGDEPAARDSVFGVTGSSGGGKDIVSAVATGEASFLAESWLEKPGDTLATRFQLSGPTITFDRLDREQVAVVGPGTMLIEDYRPPRVSKSSATSATAPAAPASETSAIGASFTGRGATLFTWKDGMTFDAKRNDVAMDGTVQMVHRTLDARDVVQLDCLKMRADFEETGGMAVWVEGGGPQPRFKRLAAEGPGGAMRIVITHADADGKQRQRTITSDHLLYEEATRLVTMHADEPRLSTVTEEGRPTPLTATVVRWDLAKDRVEALNVGVGRAPVGRND